MRDSPDAARRDDVADPRPSPANVSGFAPAASPSRIISARPRVIRPALPLSPNPRPSAAPAAMATMFFSAPHSSTPDDVGVDVEPERRRVPTRACDSPREIQVLGADDGRRRQPARDLGSEVRARQRGDAARLDACGLGDHFAHPKQRAALEALDEGQHVGASVDERRGEGRDLAQMRRRHRER